MEDIFRVLTSDKDWGKYIGNSIFFGSIIFWSITISYLGTRINRRKLLFASIIFGMFSTVLLGFVEGTFFAAIVSFLMGTSLGLGLPSSLALVSDCTVFDNRGRVSGLIILITFVIAFISRTANQIINPPSGELGFTNLWEVVILLVVLRSISIFALIIEKCELNTTKFPKNRLEIHAYKDFFVYLSTFLLFGVASGFAWNLIPGGFDDQQAFGESIRYVMIAVFSVVAGILADKVGRKQPIQIGLGALGVGFLMLGFIEGGESVILSLILSGIAWGSFFVVFLAIPGDFSNPNLIEKFYALGAILPLFGQFILAIIPPTILVKILPKNQMSVILGILLFLAIYPLQRAKETLTESKKQERKLKEHLEKVQKLVKEEETNN